MPLEQETFEVLDQNFFNRVNTVVFHKVEHEFQHLSLKWRFLKERRQLTWV